MGLYSILTKLILGVTSKLLIISRMAPLLYRKCLSIRNKRCSYLLKLKIPLTHIYISCWSDLREVCGRNKSEFATSNINRNILPVQTSS